MTLTDEKFKPYRKIGSGGWNTFNDPQDIDPTQVADVLNMVFEKGYPKPRKGSFLKWSKPDGETNDFLCFFRPKSSDGTQYAIAVYAPNMYLRDEVNNQWIKLNQSYTPSASFIDYMYSFISWNAGLGSDRMYAGNGQENTIRWNMALGYFAGSQVASDTIITLTTETSIYFPTGGGTVIVKESNTSEFTVAYTSRTGNILTLSGTLGHSVSAGAAVTFGISEVSGMARGKVMARFQRRLLIANYLGGETTLKYSAIDDPEVFSVGSTIPDGGAFVLTDGNGGITGIDDFGDFVVIEKEDSFHRFEFKINQDLNSKLEDINPVLTGESIGPVSIGGKIKKNGLIYFPTEMEGIYSYNPKVTGGQVSTDPQVISLPIQPFVKNVSFSNSRGVAYDQKLHWTLSSQSVTDYVLVYDLLRSTWTLFNNWDVQDWIVFNDILYFASRISGDIFECYHYSMTDNNNPYETRVVPKTFDMDLAQVPKTQALIFMQGYIKNTTKFFVDVLFNNGTQAEITYKIDGSAEYSNPIISDALASWILGYEPSGGSSAEEDEYSVFRVYLNIPIKYGYYVMSLRIRSNEAGSDFGIAEIAHAPSYEKQVPQVLCLDPITN